MGQQTHVPFFSPAPATPVIPLTFLVLSFSVCKVGPVTRALHTAGENPATQRWRTQYGKALYIPGERFNIQSVVTAMSFSPHGSPERWCLAPYSADEETGGREIAGVSQPNAGTAQFTPGATRQLCPAPQDGLWGQPPDWHSEQ